MLRQQLKAIQSELGEGEGEAVQLRQRVIDAKLPESVATHRPSRSRPSGADDAGVPRIPDDPHLSRLGARRALGDDTEDRLDPIEARRVLDEDHYDLDKVKERIVEYLAVQKLRQSQGDQGGERSAARIRGPILCFVGPPGVGKTSLGQSIARAMNRKFVADFARRCPRRGGDPRAPAHLHRLDARAPRAGAQEGGRRPTRC